MRLPVSLLKLTLYGALALNCASCRQPSPDEGQAVLQPSEAEEITDSGKRLSGDFRLRPTEDDYRTTRIEGQADTEIEFDDKGNFKRERRKGPGPARIEEGTYIISVKGELVLFIEKVGQEPLDAARPERYRINDQSADKITLQNGAAGSFVLQRK